MNGSVIQLNNIHEFGDIYFTSDTHFTSRRHLELCHRPFGTTNEMDIQIMRNWNEVVGEYDVVYVLGDFGDYTMVEYLKGRVILVTGNYEREDYKECGFEEFRERLIHIGFFDVIEDHLTLNVEYEDCVTVNIPMAHEPSRVSDKEFALFGHIHNAQRIKRFGLNVGCECHDYYPINLERVMFYKKGIKDFYDEEVWI